MKRSHAIALLVGFGSFASAVAVGCGSSSPRFIGETPGPDGGLGFGSDAHLCSGLQCQQKICGGGGDTTVTGTVYAPNGKLPLYNAIVYVPNADVSPIVRGATCDTCGVVSGDPVVTALSDPDGTFTLKNVPIGTDIPLVIQVGKWRRQVTIPKVDECTETHLSDPDLTRLPKDQSEGDMPQIALTTGGCDKLGCMLPKVGIAASEFGLASDGPSKAVHVYNGNAIGGGGGPGAPLSAKGLWDSADNLKAYDMVILSCECEEAREGDPTGFGAPSKGPTAFAAMTEYLNAGGRIFTTDFMYSWYRYSPDPTLSEATSMRGGAPEAATLMSIDTTFPKGQALSDWLGTVTPGSKGTVTPDITWGNIISADPTKTQQWARSGSMGSIPEGPRVFSVNVPVGLPAEQQCGKGVHIDAHVNQDGPDNVDATYPKGCASSLKEAEKLLAFFFFDLASCIQNEAEKPKPPQVK